MNMYIYIYIYIYLFLFKPLLTCAWHMIKRYIVTETNVYHYHYYKWYLCTEFLWFNSQKHKIIWLPMIQVYPKCHFCNKIKDTYLQLFISIPTWLPIFCLGLNHIWREFSQIPFYGATRKLFIISLEPTVQNSLGSLLYTTCQSVVHYDVLAAKSIDTGGYHPIDAGRLEVPGYLNGNYHRDFS